MVPDHGGKNGVDFSGEHRGLLRGRAGGHVRHGLAAVIERSEPWPTMEAAMEEGGELVRQIARELQGSLQGYAAVRHLGGWGINWCVNVREGRKTPARYGKLGQPDIGQARRMVSRHRAALVEALDREQRAETVEASLADAAAAERHLEALKVLGQKTHLELRTAQKRVDERNRRCGGTGEP